MLESFKSHIEEHFPFLKNARNVIAISGGIDSVVLAYLCHKLNFNFALAHCNFNLRGKESDVDEAFVLELGEQLNVEVFIQNFDTEVYAEENKCSIQMAARELRYDWFSELAQQLNFDYILTAHHADDNLETFLINFTRGTGLNGLTGIPALNDNIARPLLPFSRAIIEAYAKAEHITWREDLSNTSRKYLRNKLRHDVVPILKEINPQLLDSFQNTLKYLNDTADIVEESLNAVAKRAITDIDENHITFKVSEFKKVNNPKAYLFEMFKDYGFSAWNDVVNLLDAETGKYVTSSTHKLTKHREFLILTNCHSELVSESQSGLSLTKSDIKAGQVQTPRGILFFDESDALKDNTQTTVYVDLEKLKYPLELRPWQTGDVFYPIGMKGKKKVSKYLKDEKLTPIEKENTWVLTSENKIVWIVGRRADERFKVTGQTKKILKIELKD
ncbi:tRNA lysidine(34) synthetase TilS [Winogradskyella sp. J14-2]|uniref:tRNA lysidine(34) synthetase TilS n=1 Tax=Winogradskyella sp. J14-2 TaxID=1936080 RepID=UPI000972C0C0|nr:tRNA lysidine(34) synthetase TilS [Winogradskyella sp. J14-2]APY07374.1 tRNA lysidine(34) synthetase TilS [Winogradskyella sp. J14-2]